MTSPNPIPYPSHNAPAMYTDLFIKAVAMGADAKLSAAVSFYVLPDGYTCQVNQNSDGIVNFPGVKKPLTGYIVSATNKQGSLGTTTQVPSGGQIPYILSPTYITVLPWNVAPGPLGQVYVRFMVTSDRVTISGQPSTQYFYGAQPCAPGVNVRLAGIAWGPT